MHSKLVFDFNWDDPRDREIFQNVTQAEQYYDVLCNFKEVLRQNRKFKELSESQHDLLEHLTREFSQLLEDNQVIL